MKIILNIVAATTGGQITRSRAFLNRFTSFAPNSKLVVLKTVGVMTDIITTNNIEVIDVHIGTGPLRSLRRILWENTKMISLLSGMKADVYLSFSHYLPLIKLNIPSVIAVSNLAPFYPAALKLENFYGKFRLFILKYTIISSAHNAQKVIALSSMCKKILVSNKVPIDKIIKIPNGVNIINPLNFQQKNKPSHYILSVSHFYRYKNFEQIIKSYARITDKIRRNFRLVVVGKFYDQKYVQELKLLAKNLGISKNIDFIPGLEKDELNWVYSQASLFVFTSLIENSPNILLEAMSHGLPIISTDNEPMPEFGASAIRYVKANDEIELGINIEHILKNKTLKNKLAKQSKEQSKLFSWNTFTKDVIKLCNLASKEDL